MEQMNFSTSVELNTGSAITSRSSTRLLRGIALLWPLGSVFRPALLAVGDAGGIQSAADHVVAHAREVLDAAAADEHDGGLLQIVAHPGYIGCDLDAVGEPHARHLAQRRVGLLG